MYQIQFRSGLRPRPRWGSLQCSPRSLRGGLLLRGGDRKGRGWDEKGRGGEGMRLYPFTASLIHIYGYAPD